VPKISRARLEATPASANAVRAARSCSGSPSSAVSTPSARIPRSSHSPARPPPLPIDTTERASMPAASTASAAPTAGCTGGEPASWEARDRAASISGLSTAKRSAYAAPSACSALITG
jgi:hypothetical protein